MKLLRLWFLAFAILSTVSVQAAVTPVYQLNDAKGTYLQTMLTHDIYRYSASAALHDLVVIDRQGNKLPYRITALPVETTDKSTISPVRFFPVEEGTPPEKLLAISNASIRIEDNAITLSVDNSSANQVANKKAPMDFYVADISNIKVAINKLLLDWQASEANQYLEVEVSGSKDLQHWQLLSTNTLVKLEKEDQVLLRNSIPLNIQPEQYAYIKLNFLRGAEDLQLMQISTETNETLLDSKPEDQWEIPGELAADQDSALNAASYSTAIPVAAWEFERKDNAPVNHISVNLGADHYGDNIKLYSRYTAKQPWQLIYQGVWFNVQVGSDWQHSDPIPLYGNTNSFWRVELNELVRTTHKPALVLEREPQILQFIANNAAPYSIAIDDQAATNNLHTSTQIFSQLTNGKHITWQSANLVKLEPTPNSSAHQKEPVSWRTIIFWGLLLAAVGVLVGFAIRLLKQMK